MNELTARKAGCCVICDVPVYQVIKFHPETKAPTKLGSPLDGVALATWLQVSGARVELSVCGPCAKKLGSEWPVFAAWIWKRCILSMLVLRDAADKLPEPRKSEWIASHDRAIAAMLDNPPIAYIGHRPLPSGGGVMI